MNDATPSTNNQRRQVAIIGAGPSGAVAASLLKQQGIDAVVLEKQQFPRFSIGESLLPCCMSVLAEAGMVEAVNQAGFQFKNGATFNLNDRETAFHFEDKFSDGPGTTFQVPRAQFDKLLADTAAAQGCEIRYGHSVIAVDVQGTPTLQVLDEHGQHYQLQADFLLDASGFGRVLPRLLDLEQPSCLPARRAVFTHVADRISDASFDRNKIMIAVHPQHKDIWFWLIPFSNGTSSLGVVGLPEQLEQSDLEQQLLDMVAQQPRLQQLLADAEIIRDCGVINGYSANVSSLAGNNYALLGNAGEFLDPVFSSGVTIALQSAKLASDCIAKHYQGQALNWQQDYCQPLMVGVEAFRTYVEAWYDGRFQEVIFFEQANPEIRRMLCSILAGYAWDTRNPYVKDAKRRLNTLVELCREMTQDIA
ncbi:tryptophan 7-halogenase [Shewanella sp. A3A]|nr:tryptophan 7-halogenase [Shewanella ferrihydritica]